MTFEAGKTYRTRQGWFVKIREIKERSNYPLGGMFDRLTGNQWWTAQGRYRAYADGDHEHDLMPGAIEDGHGAQADINKMMNARPEPTMESRVSALECQMPAALGLTPTDRPATPVEEAINALHDRLKIVEGFLRRYTFPEPLNTSAEAKRTIKGGWVNVYDEHENYGLPLGKVYGTKALADADECSSHRLACIHIPDITEGEGL
jgi:hypothetical protein